jgi:hypothetical protein
MRFASKVDEVNEAGWAAGNDASGARLLEAARTGDSDAFGQLVEPFRGELHAHCYRMLGSVHDAKYAMPPLTAWYEGHEGIRAFLVEGPLTRRWRFLPAHANGQLAFGTYLWDEDRAVYLAAGLDLLALRGTKIAEVVSFLTPEIFAMSVSLPRSRSDSTSHDLKAVCVGFLREHA